MAAVSESNAADPAQKEAANFASGLTREQLKDQAAVADHNRNEKFRDHFERLAIYALWLASLAISGIAIVWLLHMVIPKDNRWLTSEDLTHIQSIITAGLLVGVIGNHFKKRMS